MTGDFGRTQRKNDQTLNKNCIMILFDTTDTERKAHKRSSVWLGEVPGYTPYVGQYSKRIYASVPLETLF